ncbi:MAG: lytic transglycosylase domain-containing protein, partial [Cyclobacteriaceae bacterium]
MKIFIKKLFLLLFMTIPLHVAAQDMDKKQAVKSTGSAAPGDYIHSIDSSIQMKIFEKKDQLLSGIKDENITSPDSIPFYPDMFYEYRLVELNKSTPIDIEFNEEVKKQIDRYTIEKRQEFSKIRGLSLLYFPIIEEHLLKYELPLELKYIAVIESSLNPLAKSKSGAVGLWQFLLHSGRLFDLEVNSYIDERKDPYKATDAACRYLKYLHKTFNDWLLAIAAYNGGPGEVRNAIARSGGKTNFWEIKDYMREETRNYVPKFIAAFYVMEYAAEHKITMKYPGITFYDIDTVWINNEASFQQISEKIDVPVEIIRFLNPSYTADYLPDTRKPKVLVLPSDKIL